MPPNFWISRQVSSTMDACDLLSDFRTSGVCHTPHLESFEVIFAKVLDLSTRASWKPTTWICFDPLAIRQFLLLLDHKLSNFSRSGVVDLTPLVNLDDGRSQLASGLRQVLFPVHTKVKAHALYLDRTTVDPLCSNPMVGIYFFLGEHLFFLGH
jgi:hypothetical protein